ncbi:MAG: glycosyltransferase family 9 protein [Gemmatimonadetes bacterium]|nr:glycosyltransferase family 9 protein [Gemmatimonadota bacterium]MBK7785965.1 glycosyltransferase family 9 protein [Gemmatimonadota bacterium]MBK9065351.1 glycosyltransferase family 9 protein [Gemmatimonadota bacterium]
MRPGRAVVLQTAHLGDVVLTIPLLRRLAERHGPVDVVTTPAAAPLLAGQPAVHAVIPFDKHATDAGPPGLFHLARRLRAGAYQVAWLPHRSVRSGLAAWLAGIPERAGFAGSPGRWWYTRQVPLPATGHQTTRLAALAGAVPEPPPWFTVRPEDQAQADAWLAAQAIRGPFAVLAPGARWGTKRWPWFGELAAALPLPSVVIGGADDQALAAAVVAAAPRATGAAGVHGLGVTAGIIARGAVVVSNDSVALHLAGGLARPAVALFGPTVPAFGFGPLGTTDAIVEHPALPCRPCSPHGPATCPLGHHRCLRAIGVPAVLAAVIARLEAARQ